MSAPIASAPDFLRDWPDAEQRRRLLEAPRGERQDLLAALQGLDPGQVVPDLARRSGLPIAQPVAPDPAALPLLPARLVHDYQVLPILPPTGADAPADTLHLATVWPPDADMRDWIAIFTPRPVRWHLAPADRVRQLVVENYGVGAGSIEDSNSPAFAAEAPASTEADADAAVVRFVREVIEQAIDDAATDIHFEPQEGQLRIRYRVDGLLVAVPVPENDLSAARTRKS